MKFLIIILSACLLPCISLQAQLPSSKPMPLDKILAYKKGGLAFTQTTPTSLPSESREYPKQVREYMLLKKVQRNTIPNLNFLPSTRKPDFDAIIRKYKKDLR
jgi:hypothetical protein